MRARLLKPGFFRNEELATLPFAARLLFGGLWCAADREGRLEDRPRRIKADVLPYDECDVDALLARLAASGFIQRYTAQGNRYIQVTNFSRHQQPHVREATGVIPPPPDQTGNDPGDGRPLPGPDAGGPVDATEHLLGDAAHGSSPAEALTGSPSGRGSFDGSQDGERAALAAGVESAGGTIRRSAPKPNKLAEVIDAIQACGEEVTISSRDGKAARECSAPAALIAEAYVAAVRGEWGDEVTRRNLSIWFVCGRIDGYRRHRDDAARLPPKMAMQPTVAPDSAFPDGVPDEMLAATPALAAFWRAALVDLREQMPVSNFRRWFSNVYLASLTGDAATLEAPEPVTVEQLERRFDPLVRRALTDAVGGASIVCRYLVAGKGRLGMNSQANKTKPAQAG